MTAEEKVALALEVMDAAEQYARNNHKANIGWWNDPNAWHFIEHLIKPARARLLAT